MACLAFKITSSNRRNQVFVNFRGEELRCGFVSHLVEALQRHGINVFIDSLERKGEDLINLFARIEESTIALVIFSERYTESIWCLDELLKIKQRADQGFLKVIPIFFNVEPVTVKQLRGAFGDQFRDREWEYRCDKPRTDRWKEALSSVSCKAGLAFDKRSDESKFVRIILKEVEKELQLQVNPVVIPFPGTRRDISSLGGKGMHIRGSTQEPVDLSRESFRVHDNSSISNQISVFSKAYMDIEHQNNYLRAQLLELSERLQSLNSIIEMSLNFR
ncbi:PREDICTED: vesicle-associated protein 1-4-like [Brassica oleracea var. oleracea]|uniref:vesicle-associated protein 1-4-like n=1 Tax=Brassica oleracea var. oleracea TaxID=109376 RepID=UPI0006A74CAD|nr:PREDICTED: vesicle-associated protein 1-4-like [Brassica oleracea var. oleracea]